MIEEEVLKPKKDKEKVEIEKEDVSEIFTAAIDRITSKGAIEIVFSIGVKPIEVQPEVDVQIKNGLIMKPGVWKPVTNYDTKGITIQLIPEEMEDLSMSVTPKNVFIKFLNPEIFVPDDGSEQPLATNILQGALPMLV